MRYRYVVTDAFVNNDSLIRNYRLVPACCFEKDSRISYWLRIEIPNDLILITWRGDGYSTTEDTRSLSSFKTTPIVKINGRWVTRKDLPIQSMGRWFNILMQLGLHPTIDKGWLTEKKYVEYIKTRRFT